MVQFIDVPFHFELLPFWYFVWLEAGGLNEFLNLGCVSCLKLLSLENLTALEASIFIVIQKPL